MKTETKTFTNKQTAKSAEYTVVFPESFDDILNAFKGKLEDVLEWAAANLPDNRNEYQKARLSTEPPVKQLASAAIRLNKTGLEQFAAIEACVSVVCSGPAEAFAADVLKESKKRLEKSDDSE